ncbi:hypothetical protein K435DRAFT_878171 [Dendrothele bispora CBS 962.96]|uniref:Uncharacterized protein n=1 Tax=Dendrothele bispora (strain CBS 962.96) TaxID=1314807 RepID=A0A4S8KNI5_DENBC|nr:hypothetical protein K435DRAFT_878171 [Dendrothele bispora CBS 962.96]
MSDRSIYSYLAIIWPFSTYAKLILLQTPDGLIWQNSIIFCRICHFATFATWFIKSNHRLKAEHATLRALKKAQDSDLTTLRNTVSQRDHEKQKLETEKTTLLEEKNTLLEEKNDLSRKLDQASQTASDQLMDLTTLRDTVSQRDRKKQKLEVTLFIMLYS